MEKHRLHTEPGDFQVNGVWSEDRMCQLMETKIRLAEQAKDSVCGQFQWIFSSHDNPGRRQPDEAYRRIDKVGPFNYKGLVTPWEEPLDVYYMYRANYVPASEDPMVIWHLIHGDRLQQAADGLPLRRTAIVTVCCCTMMRWMLNTWDGN